MSGEIDYPTEDLGPHRWTSDEKLALSGRREGFSPDRNELRDSEEVVESTPLIQNTSNDGQQKIAGRRGSLDRGGDMEATGVNRHDPHTALHLEEFEAENPEAFGSFFLMPVGDMMQISQPEKVLSSLRTVWSFTILAQVLIAGWMHKYFSMSFSTMKNFSDTLETMLMLLLCVAFFPLMVAILMNVILLIQSVQWARQIDIRWWLMRYKVFFLMPVYLTVLGISAMLASMCLLTYMERGLVMCIMAAVGSVVVMIFIPVFYCTLVREGKQRLHLSVSSMRAAMDAFSMLDRDKSGTISKNEVVAAMSDPKMRHLIGIPTDRVHLAFAMIDKEGRGYITWNEFIDHFAPGAGDAELSRTVCFCCPAEV